MTSRHRIAALALALALTATVVVVAPTGPTGPAAAATSATTEAKWTSTTEDFANDLGSGVGLPPSKGKAGVEELKDAQDSRLTTQQRSLTGTQLAVPSTAAAVPLGTYSVTGVVQRTTPVGQRPYEGVPLVRGLVDSSGVRMFLIAGDPTLYNHPVGQAQLTIAYLDHYRRTKLAAYLRLAKANAQRLIDRRVESRGAWYYPYDFDFAVHGDTTLTMKAPWYSGMAQGLALSAFTRLYQTTGDATYKNAADATYASLDTAPVEGEPFGSWVSSTGDLWLELYPRWPVEASERVLNGHIFAAFGLYDYAQLTGNENAMRLYDGALTTVTRYLMSDFRNAGWASLYSLGHRLPTIGYHQRVAIQMLYLQNQTGNPIYTTWAKTLRADFPDRTSKGFGVILPGTKVIYQLSSARKVIKTKVVKFTKSTGAPVNHRERAFGGPIMLRVNAGAYSGWWFPEAFTKARIRGVVDVHSYSPSLQATFVVNTAITAYKYDVNNAQIGTTSLKFTRSSGAPVTKSAIVDGRLAYFLPVGAFAGHWVGAQAGLIVR